MAWVAGAVAGLTPVAQGGSIGYPYVQEFGARHEQILASRESGSHNVPTARPVITKPSPVSIEGPRVEAVPAIPEQDGVYPLCWQGKFTSRSASQDNELTVDRQSADSVARAALAQPLLIPLPSAGWPGFIGLISVGVLSRLRQRRAIHRTARG
jgi:hypothetical protein